MKPRKQQALVLAFSWLLALLTASVVSPSYLVEGLRNHLGFHFSSKEDYVTVVVIVQCCYYLAFSILGLTTAVYLLRWTRQFRKR